VGAAITPPARAWMAGYITEGPGPVCTSRQVFQRLGLTNLFIHHNRSYPIVQRLNHLADLAGHAQSRANVTALIDDYASSGLWRVDRQIALASQQLLDVLAERVALPLENGNDWVLFGS